MKNRHTLKTLKLALPAVLFAVTLGCGYSKKMTPAQPGTMPNIVQLNPADTAAGVQFLLEVDGTNFSGTAVINFNGAAQATTVLNSTKLQATIPGSAIMNAENVPVTVTNPGTPGGPYGGGTTAQTSAAMNFTIN